MGKVWYLLAGSGLKLLQPSIWGTRMNGRSSRCRSSVLQVAVGFATLLVALGVGVRPGVASSPPFAEPESLNEVMANLLSNNCAGLGSNATGPLARLCGIPPTNAGSGTFSMPTVDSRVGAGEDVRRARRRVEERRQGASADDMAGTRGLSFFVSGDYQRFDQDSNRFETAYKKDTAGSTAGVDYSFGRFLAGVAVNYAHEFGDYAGVGGGFDTSAYGLLLYGSVVPLPNLFVDVVGGYTRKEYDFERRAAITIAPDRSVAGSTHASTSGDEVKLSVAGGYDFVIERFTVGPRLGINLRETTIDGFQERGNTGLELKYNNQNVTSLTHVVGVFASYAISTAMGVIVPQTTFEWVHEFLDDQRSIGFRFVFAQGAGKFLFRNEPPDRDYFNLNVGAVFVLPNGLAPFFNYRELLGYRDRSSHTVSLGLRFAF
jgi:outer membrane autotransporter protein